MAPSNKRRPGSREIALKIKSIALKRTRRTGGSSNKAESPLKKAASPQKKANSQNMRTTKPGKTDKAAEKKATSRVTAKSQTDGSVGYSGGSSKSIRSAIAKEKAAIAKEKAAIAKALKEKERETHATGGLRLLKRGMVTMSSIAVRVSRGIRLVVAINQKGKPFGAVAGEMQSYIGVLARTKISISIKDWRLVEKDDKQMIWQSIEEAYVIPKQCRKLVISSAGCKWRDFKCTLTRKYIIPYLANPDLLEFPPDDYHSVSKADWDAFVNTRIKESFQHVSELQRKRALANEYPHHLARKGYAGLEAELLMEGIPIEELTLAYLWVKARQGRDGSIKNPKVVKVNEKIQELKKKADEGEETFESESDFLAKALDKPEHPGRVRGAGGSADQSSCLNIAPQSSQRDQEVQIRVQLILEKELAKLAKEKEAWEEERAALKKREEDQKVAMQMELHRAVQQEVAKMYAKTCGKEVPATSPKPITPPSRLNINASENGSCSRQNEIGTGNVGIDASTVKKRLDLYPDDNVIMEEVAEVDAFKCQDDFGAQKMQNDEVEDVAAGRPSRNDETIICGASKECGLALESVDNIVAYGLILEVDVDPSQQLIHGKPLGEDNLRVSIIRAVVDDAKLPFPITGDDIVTVVDALGSIVAWPKNMVVTPAPQVPPKIVVEEVAPAPQASTKAIAKKATTSAQATRKVTNPKQTIKTVMTRRSRIVDDDDKVDLKKLPRDIPLSLRHLCAYAHDFMVDGRTIYTEFHQSLFGQPRKACLYRKDLHSMANMGEVSIGVLVFYMSFLHKGLVKSKRQKVFGFIDPAHTGISNCGTAKERAKHMADRYKQEKSVQLWLVPYNPGGHWVLTVVKPTEGLVYYLDPIKRKITCDAEWKSVVENSINWSRAAAEEKDEDKDFEITWPALKGVPEQKGDSTYGYFVMRYMREIVKSTDIMEFATKWADKRPGRAGLFTFTKAEIDEVRNEWAQHVDTFPETIERRT